MAKVSSVTIKIQTGTNKGTMFSTWTWKKEHTKEYQVRWYYATGDKVWFLGSDSTTTVKQSTFSIPDNATKIKVRIKPISKTYSKKVKKNGKTTTVTESYWTADWSTDKEYDLSKLGPELPSGTPSITLNDSGTKFTAEITVNKGVGPNATTKVEFAIYDATTDKIVKNITDSSISAQGRAAVSYTMTLNHRYRVKCRAIDKNGQTSSYTNYCDLFPDKGWAGPELPSGTPSITLNDSGTKFTAEITVNKGSGVNATTAVEFAIYDATTDKIVKNITDSSISAQGRAAVSYTMTLNHRYRVKCRAKTSNDKYSPYTDYCDLFPEKNWAKPELPSGTPSIAWNDSHTKMTIEIDINKHTGVNATTAVEFDVYDVGEEKIVSTITDSSISAQGRAAVIYTPVDGHRYRVRCRAKSDNDLYSSYTDYYPSPPDASWARPRCPEDGIYYAEAEGSDKIKLNWDRDGTAYADSYEVEYCTEKRFFDVSADNVKTITQEVSTGRNYLILTGLEPGFRYYFRLRVKGNHDNGYSDWSSIIDCGLGKKPAPPTTWSSATSAIVGENIPIYWVHNAQDNAHQSWAIIQLYVNGVAQKPILKKNSTNADYRDKTSSYTIRTNDYPNGAKIQWKVRTAGIFLDSGYNYNPSKENDYNIIDYSGNSITEITTIPEEQDFSDWSITRDIQVNARPTLSIGTSDNVDVTSYPWDINITAGPSSQKAIRYYISIIATDSYNLANPDGTVRTINNGDTIYSTVIDSSNNSIRFVINPSLCHLENNQSYKLYCLVSMNSGLVAEDSKIFNLVLEDDDFEVNAEVAIDYDDMVAYIKPYATATSILSESDIRKKFNTIHTYIVQLFETLYVSDSELKDDSNVEKVLESLKTSIYNDMDKELLYEITTEYKDSLMNLYDGMDIDSVLDDLLNIEVGDQSQYSDVLLSVYRRQFDGTYVEIESNIDGANPANCVDPHPSLDYARYRIIGVSKIDGKMMYYDMPPIPVGEANIIIQWDEQSQNFMDTSEGESDVQPYSASMLKLPYNIDIEDSHNPDVAFKEYIGRKHPVSYYGTQLGETSKWKTDIIADDIETIYALRRLSVYQGDCYIREPYGTGYWANVNVSFPVEHENVKIPVTFSITRVEGGK